MPKIGNMDFSSIAYGMMRIKDIDGKYVYDNLIKLKELGINVIDTADIYHINNYGDSERLIGNAFEYDLNLRNDFYLVTKCGILIPNDMYDIKHYNNSKQYIIDQVNNSLNNLKTDYIDLLLLHRPDYFSDFKEIYEAFKELKDSNKVKEFGVSNYTPIQYDSLKTYLLKRDIELVTNQIELSPFSNEHMLNDNIHYLKGNEISPMIYSILAGGKVFENNETNKVLSKLANKYKCSLSEIIIAYINSHGLNPCIILGSQKIERYEEAINGLSIKLTAEELHKIYYSFTQEEVA